MGSVSGPAQEGTDSALSQLLVLPAREAQAELHLPMAPGRGGTAAAAVVSSC